MPLYLKAGTSSLLRVGSTLATNSACCCGGTTTCSCTYCTSTSAPTSVLISFTISGAPCAPGTGLVTPGPGGSTYTCGPDPFNPGLCANGPEVSTGLYPLSGSVVATVCSCATAYRTDGYVFIANAVKFYSGSSSYDVCQNYGIGPCCTIDYDFSLYASVVLSPTVESATTCSFAGAIKITSSASVSSSDCTQPGVVWDPCDTRVYSTCSVPGGVSFDWSKPTISGACDPRESSWTGSGLYVTDFSVS